MATAAISVITLGIADQARSRRFYGDGFGWKAAMEMDDITFYQLNGTVLALWDASALAEDCGRPASAPGTTSLAHNVRAESDVVPLIDRLVAAGGTLMRGADAPPHGGLRGYVADPDGHAWEIAWNPGFPLDEAGNVTFGI